MILAGGPDPNSTVLVALVEFAKKKIKEKTKNFFKGKKQSDK